MATAQTIIDRSLRLIGQIGAGLSPTADETADALEALNAMLMTWRNERLMAYAIQTQDITLSSGNTSRTVGPSGNLVTTRPVRIEDAYCVVDNMTYNVRILNESEFAAIPDKTAESDWPDRIWPQMSFPDVTIYLYPIPTTTSTLRILTRVPLTEFSTAATTVSLPPGWEDALAYNLAVRIAPEYEREALPTVVQMARDTKAAIKTINSRPQKLYTELPLLVGNYTANIITDQP